MKRLGIKKWPFRKKSTINNMLSDMEASPGCGEAEPLCLHSTRAKHKHPTPYRRRTCGGTSTLLAWMRCCSGRAWPIASWRCMKSAPQVGGRPRLVLEIILDQSKRPFWVQTVPAGAPPPLAKELQALRQKVYRLRDQDKNGCSGGLTGAVQARREAVAQRLMPAAPVPALCCR